MIKQVTEKRKDNSTNLSHNVRVPHGRAPTISGSLERRGKEGKEHTVMHLSNTC
jgi:hypothetical protein